MPIKHLNRVLETLGTSVLFTIKTIIFRGAAVVHVTDAYLGIFEKATFFPDGPLLHTYPKLPSRSGLWTQVRDRVWDTECFHKRSFVHYLLMFA